MIDVRRSSYKQGNMHSFKTAVGSRILGSLEAPRMFQDDIRPTALCKMWIQHPTYCTHGDGCTFAHGSRAHLKGLAEYPTELLSSTEASQFRIA